MITLRVALDIWRCSHPVGDGRNGMVPTRAEEPILGVRHSRVTVRPVCPPGQRALCTLRAGLSGEALAQEYTLATRISSFTGRSTRVAGSESRRTSTVRARGGTAGRLHGTPAEWRGEVNMRPSFVGEG